MSKNIPMVTYLFVIKIKQGFQRTVYFNHLVKAENYLDAQKQTKEFLKAYENDYNIEYETDGTKNFDLIEDLILAQATCKKK